MPGTPSAQYSLTIRVKIDDADSPKLIHTVRGMGYVIDVNEPE